MRKPLSISPQEDRRQWRRLKVPPTSEEVSEKACSYAYLQTTLMKAGVFTSRIKDDYQKGTKFEMYRDFKIRVKDIAPHNMLALLG